MPTPPFKRLCPGTEPTPEAHHSPFGLCENRRTTQEPDGPLFQAYAKPLYSRTMDEGPGVAFERVAEVRRKHGALLDRSHRLEGSRRMVFRGSRNYHSGQAIEPTHYPRAW